MRGMATGARRGHGEPALQQSPAVNAFAVVLNNIVLPSRIAQRRFMSFAVATTAEFRNIGWEGTRLRIMLAQNPVRAMALLATWSIGVLLTLQLPVRAGRIYLSDFVMTGSAIHRFGDGLARPYVGSVDLRMALAARDFGVPVINGVDGMPNLIDIHKKRLSVAGALDLRVRVAMHAIRVGHAFGVEDVAKLVRLVAVHARGQNVGFLFLKRSIDDLPVHAFNLGVAFGAGRSNILPVNRGRRVGMRQDQVRRVAGGAVRRDRKTLFQQRLAVDAF